jgi:CBS domain-containing protein
MRAKDVMSVDVVTVGPDDSVERAVKLMLEHRISGLPVVDPDGNLLGVVTEGDLMDRVEITSDEPWRRHPAVGDKQSLSEYVKSHSARVGDVMVTEAVTADEATPLAELADMMARHHIRRVIVTREGKVAGVVSRADLIRGFVTAPEAEPGPVDDDLRRKVLNRLHVELGLSRSDTGVTIRDGKVVLWGTVPTEEELKAAEVAAETLAGADRVVSYLRVQPPR